MSDKEPDAADMDSAAEEDIEALLESELSQLEENSAKDNDEEYDDDIIAEGFLPELEINFSSGQPVDVEEPNSETEDITDIEMTSSFADLKASIDEKLTTAELIQSENTLEASTLLEHTETILEESKLTLSMTGFTRLSVPWHSSGESRSRAKSAGSMSLSVNSKSLRRVNSSPSVFTSAAFLEKKGLQTPSLISREVVPNTISNEQIPSSTQTLPNEDASRIESQIKEDLDQTLEEIQLMTKSEQVLLEALHKDLETVRKKTIPARIDAKPISPTEELIPANVSEVHRVDVKPAVPAEIEPAPKASVVSVERQQEIAEAQYLEAVLKKIRFEFESLRTQIKTQTQRQKDLQHKFEMLKMSKASRQRSHREAKAKIPTLQDKVKHIHHLISEDLRLAFEREKERSGLLVEKVSKFMTSRTPHLQSLQNKVDQGRKKKISLEAKLESLNDNLSRARVENYDLECSKTEMNDAFNALEDIVAPKRQQKKDIVEGRIRKEAMEREAELELLYEAWERRKAFKIEGDARDELDVIDFSTKKLKKIPRLLASESPTVKYANFDHNIIDRAYGLDRLTELLCLSMNNNLMTTFDATGFGKLRNLSLAHNKLQTIMGLSDQLLFMDLSDNPMITWNGLSAASALQILLMRSTRVTDLSFLKFMRKLLYLDLSKNRLTEQAVDSFFECSLVQYFDGSDNLFREFPDVSNGLIYEMNLSVNLITRLSTDNWLLMLRVLNLNNNPINDVQPLGTLPFLRELYLDRGHINDVNALYALCVSQFLEVLDLSENTVTSIENYRKIVGTLFPRLRILDKQQVDRDPKSLGRRNWLLVRALHIVKLIEPAVEQLSYYVRDTSLTLEAHKAMLAEIQYFAEVRERDLTSFLGPYSAPYLEYLTRTIGIHSQDGLARMLAQERKLSWMHTFLSEAEMELQDVARPSHDTMIVIRISQLKEEIRNQQATYIQALWRAKRQKKRYLHANVCLKKLQIAVRSWLVCKKARALLEQLREEKRLDAAKHIQKHARGLLARKKAQKIKDRKKREADEAKRVEEIAAQLTKTVEEVEALPLDDDLDTFLSKDIDKEFDKKMETYLATEKLEHFANDVSVPPATEQIKEGGVEEGDLAEDETGEDLEFGGVNALYYKLNRFKMPLSEKLAQDRHMLINELRTEYTGLLDKTHHLALRSSSPEGILMERTFTARRQSALGGGHFDGPLGHLNVFESHHTPLHSDSPSHLDVDHFLPGRSSLTVPMVHEHHHGGHIDDAIDESHSDSDPAPHDLSVSTIEHHHTHHEPENGHNHGRSSLAKKENHHGHAHVNFGEQDRDAKLSELEKARKEAELDDLMKRLNGHSRKEDTSLPSSLKTNEKATRQKSTKPLDVVYEWDIHPGETAKKLSHNPIPKIKGKYQVTVTGPGASLLAPPRDPKLPKIIPLINNYVKRTPPPVSPIPVNIHSFDPALNASLQSEVPFRPLGNHTLYPTDLDRIATQAPIPGPYKSFSLSPHRPLPAITPPPIPKPANQLASSKLYR